MSVTTKGFIIGMPEAEAENHPKFGLTQVFQDYLSIQDKIEQGKFLILGRKGTGKSAFAKHLINTRNAGGIVNASLITPRDFKAEAILQLLPVDRKENHYTLLFEWKILLVFAKMIVDSKMGKYTQEYKSLESFLKKNSGCVDIDQYATEFIQNGKDTAINMSPLLKVLGAQYRRGFSAKQVKAPFYALIPGLKDVISKMLKFEELRNVPFNVLFDDLDIGFHLTNTDDCDQLIELIRVTREYNNETLMGTRSKVLLFIREDVADVLCPKYVDAAKILRSYSYSINWYDADDEDEDTLIRRFINKRLAVNFKAQNIRYNQTDPWQTFVKDDEAIEYGRKTAFKYILDFTFYKPRDLLLFFNNIGDRSFSLPLMPQSIKRLQRQYLEAEMQEISNELSTYYSDEHVKGIFDFFDTMAKEVAGSKLRYDRVMELLAELDFTREHFENLVSHDYIVPSNDIGHFFLTYREDKVKARYEEYQYSLHKCIFAYFMY